MAISEEEAARRAAELESIRPTDNSVRPEDGPQPPQDDRPLELGPDGLPKNIKIGGE